MGINKIVEQLREAAPDFENKEVYLPVELVKVITGRRKEKSWKKISADRVIKYIADMLEE